MLGPLPPAYGPYEFQPGDRNKRIDNNDRAVPVYGGQSKPPNPPASDLITLVQTDLHAIGIGLGLQDSGFYAYRRWSTGKKKYDGKAAAAPASANRKGDRKSVV